MSAIAGLVRFDGQSAAARQIERMANALRGYGPDRLDVTVAGPAGLAHLLMRTTPEDQFERQPLRGKAGIVLAADLRLDNRDELLERLGIGLGTGASWPDSRILLVVWEKYGDEAWGMLRGPFAAAIWDPRRACLTLARDHLGLNVVMWHKSEHFFAFATMPKGLLALEDVPREINEQKLADFLVLNHCEQTTTFYSSINRLPAAHFATIDLSGRIALRRYWSPTDIKPIRLKSDQDYADGLRFHLERAVKRQLRTSARPAFYLTGGLDSSAVVAFAAPILRERGQRLAAFTQVPREGFAGRVSARRYADETPFVEAIRAAIDTIDVTYVRNDEHDDFADLDRVSLAFEYPVRNTTNLGWMLAIPRLARAGNHRVLIGGNLGNITSSWDGWSQSSRHLLRGRFRLALNHYRAFYRGGTSSRWVAFRKLFLDPAWSDRLVALSDRIRRKGLPWGGYSAIDGSFASQMQVRERAAATGHDFRYRRVHGQRARMLSMVDYIGDWYAAQKAMFGVEGREPLVDIDLLEYCFGIPEEQYLVGGVDRSLIRRAMQGLLPDSVLANCKLGLQSADWYEKLDRQRTDIESQFALISASPLARRALDLERMRRALDDWSSYGADDKRATDELQLALARGLSVGRFLRWFEATNA